MGNLFAVKTPNFQQKGFPSIKAFSLGPNWPAKKVRLLVRPHKEQRNTWECVILRSQHTKDSSWFRFGFLANLANINIVVASGGNKHDS